jgi:hypothetical protein
MSEKSLEQIIGRILLDREFRSLMVSDMDKALMSYDLTEDELKSLKSLEQKDFHRKVTGLDQRTN